MSYGSSSSYQGYQGGGGGHHNPYRSRRRDYEDINNGTTNAMKSMEVLSGREYGIEYEEGGNEAPVLKHRGTIYCLIAFLVLIVVVSPHRDRSASASSNFKLPKNTSNSTHQPSNSVTKSTQAPSSSPFLSGEVATTAPSKLTNASTSTPSPKPPQTTNTTTTTASSMQPEYATQCQLPTSFRIGQDNYTFLNATNFCLAEPLPDVPCNCSNPVRPTKPSYALTEWPLAMNMNIGLVNASKDKDLDVVLVGDSITEHWNGRDMAEFRPKDHNASVVFQQLFQKQQNGSEVEGLALGIAGDRTQNVLYRLQHGEMPPSLKPKVWWILIGTNDLGSDSCNANAITAGTIRIVEEIRRHQPNAVIVINSILPRGPPQKLLYLNPMWPIMQVINSRLRCYAQHVTRPDASVIFYNATELFVYHEMDDDEDKAVEEVYINQTLMNDYLHPSGEGALVFGVEIVKLVLALTAGGRS